MFGAEAYVVGPAGPQAAKWVHALQAPAREVRLSPWAFEISGLQVELLEGVRLVTFSLLGFHLARSTAAANKSRAEAAAETCDSVALGGELSTGQPAHSMLIRRNSAR